MLQGNKWWNVRKRNNIFCLQKITILNLGGLLAFIPIKCHSWHFIFVLPLQSYCRDCLLFNICSWFLATSSQVVWLLVIWGYFPHKLIFCHGTTKFHPLVGNGFTSLCLKDPQITFVLLSLDILQSIASLKPKKFFTLQALWLSIHVLCKC